MHFPWCRRRCPYCDFTVTTRRPIPHEDYARAVAAELRARSPDFVGPARTIYFGGGTPGLWAAASVGAVIGAVESTLGLRADAELTLEANPEDLSAATLRGFRGAGINRISLGAQSLDDEVLSALGRGHRGADVVHAVAAARLAGFENLSLDLIHGWRGQSVAAALADLDQALALAPDHVSLYQLTIEAQTRFGAEARRGQTHLADEDALVDMFDGLRARLRAAGFVPYEISSAARPGFEAVHNQLYWTGAPYLGLGAGAHGYRPTADGGALRWRNERHAQRYQAAALLGSPSAAVEVVDPDTHRFERLMTGLRLDAGHRVDPATAARFGPTAEALSARGLLHLRGDRWAASERGRALLDHVVARFFEALGEVRQDPP